MRRWIPVVLLALLGAGLAYSALPGTSEQRRVTAQVRAIGASILLGRDEAIAGLSYGEGALWASLFERPLHRVDPRSGTAVPVRGTSGAFAVHAGAGAVWALQDVEGLDPVSQSWPSTLLRIDPRTLAVTDRVRLGATGGGFASDGERIYAVVHDTIAKLDRATGRVRRRLRFDRLSGILAARGRLWATSYERKVVAELDPGSGRVLRQAPLEHGAEQLGIDDGRVVALQGGSSHMQLLDADGRRARDVGVADLCARRCRADRLAEGDGQAWILGARRGPGPIVNHLRRPSQPTLLLSWPDAAFPGCCEAATLGDGAIFVSGSGTRIGRIELP